ncbi:flagellar biosynthesis regulator FlaF [Labrenzia sp. CE80]|uniref:flagellar biosynthesis regulator FlaF n=1 Tax=Labrenzia sp. CE80 TaxID=1788986 RepID=UPI00129B09B5|nr:flagellar biosynthesis regulator FlaF [Labrenzia sp. CE80]
MYNLSYAETMDEICSDDRMNEAEAMDIVIGMLEVAQEKGTQSREAVEAIFNTRRLWTYFMESLSDDANALPTALRADLISVGIWVLKEIEKIRQNEVKTFDGLIQINSIIRDSLQGASS